jgi:hypothetical protein
MRLVTQTVSAKIQREHAVSTDQLGMYAGQPPVDVAVDRKSMQQDNRIAPTLVGVVQAYARGVEVAAFHTLSQYEPGDSHGRERE